MGQLPNLPVPQHPIYKINITPISQGGCGNYRCACQRLQQCQVHDQLCRWGPHSIASAVITTLSPGGLVELHTIRKQRPICSSLKTSKQKHFTPFSCGIWTVRNLRPQNFLRCMAQLCTQTSASTVVKGQQQV